MEIAIWIIAICEVIRAAQNLIQLAMLKRDTGKRDDVYSEFIRSLKLSDREYMINLWEKFKEAKDGIH